MKTGHWLGVVVAGLLPVGCSREPVRIIAPEEVWEVVCEEAARVHLDPGFVYAVVWAESSLNAHAENGEARGLMQLTPAAWEMVSDASFDRAFQWRTNLRAGADYLALNRDFLVQAERFNYPLLAACYRFGRNRVAREKFEIGSLPVPQNRIYGALFSGNLWPVAPPGREQSAAGSQQ